MIMITLHRLFGMRIQVHSTLLQYQTSYYIQEYLQFMGCESEWDCASVAVLSISPEYRFVVCGPGVSISVTLDRHTTPLQVLCSSACLIQTGSHPPIRLHHNELAKSPCYSLSIPFKNCTCQCIRGLSTKSNLRIRNTYGCTSMP